MLIRSAILRAARSNTNPTQRERLEDAWVNYLAKDDRLLGELLSLASKAHAWSRRYNGVMIPLVPTETGDLIAEATQLTDQRAANAAMIRRTFTLDQ